MHILTALVLAATLYHVEPVNGTVSFSIMKWGVIREEGSFRDFTADIQYDQKQPAKSHVAFTVKTASIDTKNDSRDSTLRSEHFLDVKKHPAITFKSVKVEPKAANLAHVTGDLTIRGVTKRITVPVKLIGVSRQGSREMAGFETEFKVNRLTYGVTGGGWTKEFPGILGEEVTIRIVAGGVTR